MMDHIEGMPVARDLQTMLEGTASSRAFAPVFKRRRSRGKPPAPPSPPPSDSKPEKTFFFLLVGDHAHLDQVVRAQSVDLHFLYDIPSVDALARLESKTLDELAEAARDGELLEIGVFILPIGFTFRGNEGDYKIVRIKGNEQLDTVVFKLRASDTPESRHRRHRRTHLQRRRGLPGLHSHSRRRRPRQHVAVDDAAGGQQEHFR